MSSDTRYLVVAALEAIVGAKRQAEMTEPTDLARATELAASYLTHSDFVRAERALASLRSERTAPSSSFLDV